VLETKTGKPVVYVANGGVAQDGARYSSASQIDGIQSRRQLGSTIKPFVYAMAYELGVIDPSTLLTDSPEHIDVGDGRVYQPRNYDHVFRGFVGAGEALGSSMNVPAVRVLNLVSESRVLEAMHKLGFGDLGDDEQYGPSLALGTVDATLWELAEAYRRLSLFDESKFDDSEKDGEFFSKATKQMIFESLAVPENRRFTFGIQSPLQLPFPAAVKTGTSKDMRDNWCVGYTSEYTVAVWVGNFDGSPMWNVSGLSGAAPLWRRMMQTLHRERRPQDEIPQYREPQKALPQKALSRIEYPVKGMRVGLDPDIPPHLQKLPLRVEGDGRGLLLYMNGRRLSSAERIHMWTPRFGRHRLELRDRGGRVVDDVSFFVR
jgi:penicillin-binding protein 1C